MRFFSALLTIFLFLSTSLLAEKNYFLKFYEKEATIFHNVLPTSDNGSIMSGLLKKSDKPEIKILRTDANGDTVFSKTFATTEVERDKYRVELQPLPDGGYMVLGTVLDVDLKKIIMIRLDQNCDTLWTKKIAAASDISSYRLLPTLDGGWLIGGFINKREVLLTKTDFFGEVSWQNNYGKVSLSTGSYNVIQEADSGFVFPLHNTIFKIAKDGSIVWEKEISIKSSAVQKVANYLYFAGETKIVKADLNGNEIKSFQYLFDDATTANELKTIDNNLFIGGRYLIKCDTSGSIVFDKNLKAEIFGIELMESGDIYTCGGEDDLKGLVGWMISMNQDGFYKYLELIAPNGGEDISVRQKYNLQTRVSGFSTIKAELSLDSGQTYTELVGDLINDGDYFKTNMPDTISNFCLVRISVPTEAEYVDISDSLFRLIEKFNQEFDQIAVNNINMWFSKHGSGSHDPSSDASGLYWPDGILSATYQDGFLWGSKIDNSPMVYGNTYRDGLIAGNIGEDGLASNPDSSIFKVWKVRKNWQDLPEDDPEKERLEYDWNNWPVALGAPYLDLNGNGVYNPEYDNPLVYGDETNWMVMNSLDAYRASFLYGADPTGVESQVTIYAYDREDDLKDVIFKKYRLYNKGSDYLNSTYFSYWMDPDLGDASDDLVGCDTELNLAYCYNGDSYDEGSYLGNIPAIGYLMLQGPVVTASSGDSALMFDSWYTSRKNLSLTSYTMYIGGNSSYYDPQLGTAAGSNQMYNNMMGISWNGLPMINPITEQETKFALNGDPVNKVGWYDGEGWDENYGDRRMLMSSGPFNFAPGDSQEVVYAIIMARGTDYLDSVTELKRKAGVVRDFYYNNIPTAISDKNEPGNPAQFVLVQNYPNPFNPVTTIDYELQLKSDVSLTVYNVLGQKIKTLVKTIQQAGKYSVKFEAGNLATGLYYYKLKTANFEQTKKMMLIR